jgi:hypothetical protein
MARNRRLFAAVMLAALFGFERFGVRQIARAAWLSFRSLLPTTKRIPRNVYFRRLRTCFRCPFFFGPLRTCGSPVSLEPHVGCWCNMERKAALRDAECWANVSTNYEFGWKD